MNKMLELETKLMVKTSLQEIVENVKRKVIFSVPYEDLKKLEENELFVEATKEGFSKEELEKAVVPLLNYIIENINVEKIINSRTMKLAQLLYINKEIDVQNINGKAIFEWLDVNGCFADVYSTEFKKQRIFTEAAKLAINKGNITFDTAVKRTIFKMEVGDSEFWGFETGKKEIDSIINVINNLVDFYLENELEFISSFMTKK